MNIDKINRNDEHMSCTVSSEDHTDFKIVTKLS